MKMYFEAARIVRDALAKSKTVKSAVFSSSISNKKALYALVSETIRYRVVLKELLQRCNLLKREKRLKNDDALAMVLLYEHVLGKGVHGGLKENVLHHKQAIHAQCEMMKIKAGVTDLKDLLPVADRRTEEMHLPKYVRVNTILKTTHQVVKAFVRDGYRHVPCDTDRFHEVISSLTPGIFTTDPHIPDLLVFPYATDLHNNALYQAGEIILQDKASCFPAYILSPPERTSVIDCCAAPGNKTSHLACIMNNTGVIHAFDKDKKRLSTLKKQMEKARATCVKAECCDFLSLDSRDPKYQDVEYILVDPSCSGSGMVAHHDRNTDKEEPVSKSRLAQLSKFQITILKHALSFPNVAKVVYSTCSIHEEENENVVFEVLSQVDDQFCLQHIFPEWPIRGVGSQPCAKHCLRMSHDQALTNGFFVSCFERKQKMHSENGFTEGDQIQVNGMEMNQTQALVMTTVSDSKYETRNNGVVQKSISADIVKDELIVSKRKRTDKNSMKNSKIMKFENNGDHLIAKPDDVSSTPAKNTVSHEGELMVKSSTTGWTVIPLNNQENSGHRNNRNACKKKRKKCKDRSQ